MKQYKYRHELKFKISNSAAEVLKQKLTDDFITDLVLNATDTGTYELLEEFINNPDFNKYLEKQGVDCSGVIKKQCNSQLGQTQKK